MRRLVATLAVVLSLAALAGCGGGGGDGPAPTTTTVTAAPTTTLVQGDPKGIACLNNSAEALKLFNDFNVASRGIVAPDPEPYRLEAIRLRSDQARLGCPGELLKGFLDG